MSCPCCVHRHVAFFDFHSSACPRAMAYSPLIFCHPGHTYCLLFFPSHLCPLVSPLLLSSLLLWVLLLFAQDTFLPHVECGTVTLIGATTENPSFQVNSALLSRCRVIVLERLSVEAMSSILKRALDALGIQPVSAVDSEDDRSDSAVHRSE